MIQKDWCFRSSSVLWWQFVVTSENIKFYKVKTFFLLNSVFLLDPASISLS